MFELFQRNKLLLNLEINKLVCSTSIYGSDGAQTFGQIVYIKSCFFLNISQYYENKVQILQKSGVMEGGATEGGAMESVSAVTILS